MPDAYAASSGSTVMRPSDAIVTAAALRTAIVRGSSEYQGQKCSAVSRAYMPASLWSELTRPLIEELTVVDPRDFRNLIGAVIDEREFTSSGSPRGANTGKMAVRIPD